MYDVKMYFNKKNISICRDHFLRSDYNFKTESSYKLFLNETAVPFITPDPFLKKRSPINIVYIKGKKIAENPKQNIVI